MSTAKILCAPNVTDEAYSYILKKMAERFGDVACERENDASLLGGFVVLYDGKIYDMSLRTQLTALRNDCESKG